MCQTLLVPLDGSVVGEQALPLALHIADRAAAVLRLVRVHVLYAHQERGLCWLPYNRQFDAECAGQEQAYLDGVAQRLARVSSRPMTTAVVHGLPIDAILREAQRADLIVMATVGHGVWTRAAFGVADEVVRRAPAPVLLVPARQSGAPPHAPAPRHVLIPLDGSALAEDVLESALDLGGRRDVRYTLLRVAARPLFGGDSSPDHLPSGARCAAAKEYLERVAERLRARGLLVDTRVVCGKAASAILAEARRQGADLIALATHAYGGLKRLLVGSVADQIHRHSPIPILICRGSSRAQETREDEELTVAFRTTRSQP